MWVATTGHPSTTSRASSWNVAFRAMSSRAAHATSPTEHLIAHEEVNDFASGAIRPTIDRLEARGRCLSGGSGRPRPGRLQSRGDSMPSSRSGPMTSPSLACRLVGRRRLPNAVDAALAPPSIDSPRGTASPGVEVGGMMELVADTAAGGRGRRQPRRRFSRTDVAAEDLTTSRPVVE